MLGSILPGIRHTRTPFIAGVMWFLVAWFSLGGRALVPSLDGGPIEVGLRGLFDLAGRPATAAALSLVAVLVGGVIPTISRSAASWLCDRLTLGVAILGAIPLGIPLLVRGWFSPIAGGSRKGYPDYAVDVCYAIAADLRSGKDAYLRWGDLLAPPAPSLQLWTNLKYIYEHPDHRTDRVRDQMKEQHGKPDVGPDVLWDEPIEVNLFEEQVVESLEEEFDDLAVQLQIRHESVYGEVDRLNAESELRRAMFFPGIALAITVALQTSAWAWLLLLVPLALLWSGTLSQRDAQLRVFMAVKQGLIESPTVKFVAAIDR